MTCQGIPGVRIVDEDLRTLLKRGDKILQDANAILIRPVVEDGAKVLRIRAFDGLGREEIVSHERHPILKVNWQLFSACRYCALQVLDNK